MHWMRFAPLQIWLQYSWETSKVFYLPKCATRPSCLRPLHGNAPIRDSALSNCALVFQLTASFRCQMKGQGFTFRYNHLLGLFPHGGKSHDDGSTLYSDYAEARNWGFADVPFDSDVDFGVSLRRELDVIWELCRFTDVSRPKIPSGVFSLALQDLNAFSEHGS